MASVSNNRISLHWFRKGLRLHDNPALVAACRAGTCYPVFVMDPWYAKPDIIGINRYSFVLESMKDLDDSLRQLGSRLYVFRGKPEIEIPKYIQEWKVNYLTFEVDTDGYSRIRDTKLIETVNAMGGVEVETFTSHTIFSYSDYMKALNGKPAPVSYGSFGKL